MITAKRETWYEILFDTVRGSLYLLSALYLPMTILYLLARVVIGDRFNLLAFINNFGMYLITPAIAFVFFGLLLRSRWVTLLALPAAIVALSWLVPRVLSSPPVPSSDTRLHVLTFNLYQGNPDVSNALDWVLTTDAEIITLQEVPLHFLEDADGLRKADAQYPYKAGVFIPGADWGNVLLSKYPIISAEQIDVDHGFADAAQQRYELDINGERIALYNVHFAFPIRGGRRGNLPLGLQLMGAYDPSIRNNQMWTVLGQIDAENIPVIMAGDLNMSDQDNMYRQWDRFLDDAFWVAGRGLGTNWPLGIEGWYPTFLPPALRFNYIWYSSDFRAIEAFNGPDYLGSDHLPLYTTLEYSAAG